MLLLSESLMLWFTEWMIFFSKFFKNRERFKTIRFSSFREDIVVVVPCCCRCRTRCCCWSVCRCWSWRRTRRSLCWCRRRHDRPFRQHLVTVNSLSCQMFAFRFPGKNINVVRKLAYINLTVTTLYCFKNVPNIANRLLVFHNHSIFIFILLPKLIVFHNPSILIFIPKRFPNYNATLQPIIFGAPPVY